MEENERRWSCVATMIVSRRRKQDEYDFYIKHACSAIAIILYALQAPQCLQRHLAVSLAWVDGSRAGMAGVSGHASML